MHALQYYLITKFELYNDRNAYQLQILWDVKTDISALIHLAQELSLFTW